MKSWIESVIDSAKFVFCLCRQELFEVECQLLQNALEYQRFVACIHEWQRKQGPTDGTVKDSQELMPSASHDSHVTQHEPELTSVPSTNELHLPHPIEPPPQVCAKEGRILHSISPDSGTEIGISGNHDNTVMEPEEVSTAREEVATLVAEKQRLEAQHRRLDRQLQEVKTKMAETKEVGKAVK